MDNRLLYKLRVDEGVIIPWIFPANLPKIDGYFMQKVKVDGADSRRFEVRFCSTVYTTYALRNTKCWEVGLVTVEGVDSLLLSPSKCKKATHVRDLQVIKEGIGTVITFKKVDSGPSQHRRNKVTQEGVPVQT